MHQHVNRLLKKIKQEKPILLNITNYVTMDFIANGLLSLGASPVMSMSTHEAEDLLQLAKVVVINLGTLNEKFLSLCEMICAKANTLKKPIILDPVGAGATLYRTQSAKRLADHYQLDIIRGNASEISALSTASATTKGVDSHLESRNIVEEAIQFSHANRVALAISGKTDVIIDGEKIYYFDGGSQLMPSITGTGCLLSAVVGAFHAVENDRFIAASTATTFYGQCGENASIGTIGPGSFKVKFLDALYAAP
jgi:hydroxyethylthiazole kinase